MTIDYSLLSDSMYSEHKIGCCGMFNCRPWGANCDIHSLQKEACPIGGVGGVGGCQWHWTNGFNLRAWSHGQLRRQSKVFIICFVCIFVNWLVLFCHMPIIMARGVLKTHYSAWGPTTTTSGGNYCIIHSVMIKCHICVPPRPTPVTPPYEARKYLVFEDSLMELLRSCPTCTRTCELGRSEVGTFLSVKQVIATSNMQLFKAVLC